MQTSKSASQATNSAAANATELGSGASDDAALRLRWPPLRPFPPSSDPRRPELSAAAAGVASIWRLRKRVEGRGARKYRRFHSRSALWKGKEEIGAGRKGELRE